MKSKTAGYLVFYGGFLILLGVLGYLSNPEKAKTALMSGGTFGSLSILWGVLGACGVRWSRSVAIATTGFLALIFTWRATASWLAVSEGKSEKLFAASLISLMLVASALMLVALFRSSKLSPIVAPPSGNGSRSQ